MKQTFCAQKKNDKKIEKKKMSIHSTTYLLKKTDLLNISYCLRPFWSLTLHIILQTHAYYLSYICTLNQLLNSNKITFLF